MSRASVNFQALAHHLQAFHANLIPTLVSGGSVRGHEYHAASVFGGHGDSFKFNMLTGKWADFANPEHKGGDIISLYALVHNVTNLEAAKQLADMTSFNFTPQSALSEKLPSMIHGKYGSPSGFWLYKNNRGINSALVIRYDPANERKQFLQWHFSTAENKWIPKAHPDPRPLYKLDQIERNKQKTIVLCEGEKSAEAAQELFGEEHISTCWMGGAQAHSKTDFSPLFGRSVILWPDSDDAGKSAMAAISKKIVLQVAQLSAIDPKPDDPQGYDAHDLLQTAPDILTFDEFLNDRLKTLKSIAAPVASQPSPALPELGSETQKVTGVASLYSEDQQDADFLSESNMMVLWQQVGLAMKSQTKPYLNEQNIMRIIKKDHKLNMCVYYDEFLKSYMSTFSAARPESFSDITFTKFKLFIQEQYGLGDISTSTIKESLRYYASGTIKNEVADYLKTLKWDGNPRIESFMHLIYGAENNAYNSAVSRIFWLSLVARIIEPACKADIMVILEGGQGIQKSSSLEEIGSLMGRDFYSVAGKRLDNKDFYIGLQGKFIVEMGEINAILKNSDEDIKEMLSTRIDHYRIPYASEATPNARTNIFVGTTNQENYLRDETGSRRFLPVKCTDVNMELLKEHKLQFFAEALHRKLQGEDHWEFPKDLAKAETDLRMEMDDIWTDPIMDYCSIFREVKISDIATMALNMPTSQQDNKALTRISKILKRNGFVKAQSRDENGRCWIYINANNNGINKSWTHKLRP